jgi:N utilization substance protein A
MINGMVQRMEHGDLIVDLGKAEGILPRREQVFRESFNRGERIRAYVLDVRKTTKNALVILSRTHIGLIKGLFEMEVPEISEGMVEIMGVVREPNGRTKISVRTNDREIDAVGACVGMRGMRVQSIVQELRGEKIDIVEFSEDSETYLKNALSPAKVSRVVMNADEKQMTVIVAEDQMSLAIGKKGQNVRLAAKLVRWKVDIKGPSESMGLGLGQEHPFLTPAVVSTVDFLDDVKNAKGLGEKVMTILFTNDLVTYEEALIRGVKGLTQLTGIGPKKAEALILLAEEQKKQLALKQKAAKEAIPEVEEPTDTETPDNDKTPAEEDEVVAEGDVQEEASEVEEEEEEEVLIQELIGLTPEVLKNLADNGFETIAELSVAPLDELMAIEGVDEEMGKSILEQVKERLENTENV